MSVDFEGARHYIIERLERELAPNLYYHGVHHTNDVLAAAERLAAAEGVSGEALLLLRTAALYHDTGYLVQYFQNEKCGVAIAAEALPSFGYSPEQVKVVGDMIMATQVPQRPRGHLQQLICDADLDGLGRDDFVITSLQLRLELAAYGHPVGVREWFERQLVFLEEHHYFTDAAKKAREANKQRHMQELRDLVDH